MLASAESDTIHVATSSNHWCSGLMSKACVRARVNSVAFVLLLIALIAFPAPALAQRAKVSFRIAPFGSPNLSPLFKVDVVNPVSHGGVTVPSFSLTDTKTGPQFTNLARCSQMSHSEPRQWLRGSATSRCRTRLFPRRSRARR